MAKVPRLQLTRSIEQGDLNPVGMIVASMLTEAQFQSLNGSSWVLAAGQSVAGTLYATVTGNTTAPDLRGMILRGKNNGRVDGQQDVDGERTLGALQGQSTKLPNSGFSTSSTGSHQHNTLIGGAGSIAAYPGDNSHMGSSSGGAGWRTYTDGQGVHSHSITAGGDSETRPKNIAVNHFIKVN